MRAAVVTDGVIKIETVPVPEPGAGQVRVKVRAASVNPVDWKLAARAAAGTSQTPGRDFAGVIDAVGDVGGQMEGRRRGHRRRRTGAPMPSTRSHRRTRSPPSPRRCPLPRRLGIGVVAETAWRAIVTVGDVQKGQRVLDSRRGRRRRLVGRADCQGAGRVCHCHGVGAQS